jgi:alpha-tubulin suppressor-like RCC1 family protein
MWSGAIQADGMMCGHGDYNNDGQLGLNNRTQYSSPKQIPGTTWNSILMQMDHIIWVATNPLMELCTWGKNNAGQLGQNNRTDLITSSNTWYYLVFLWRKVLVVLATKTDNTLWAWGDNTQYGIRTK